MLDGNILAMALYPRYYTKMQSGTLKGKLSFFLMHFNIYLCSFWYILNYLFKDW